jgi:tetratricopeptide (TPR) repeat protein
MEENIEQPKSITYSKPKKNIFELIAKPFKEIFSAPENPFIADGYKLAEQENYDNAILAFKSALQQNEKDKAAFIGMARVYQKMGGISNSKSSIKQFNKALEIDPAMIDIYNNLIELYKRLGDNKNAILEHKKQFVAKSLRIDADDPLANNNMGVIQMKQKKLDSAIRFFQKALKKKPSFLMARANLAKALFQKGIVTDKEDERKDLLKKSAKRIEEVISKQKTAEHILLKAKIFFHYGQEKKALVFCDEAHSMDPSMKEILATKRVIEEKMGNIVKANEAFEGYQSLKKAETSASK